MTPEEAAELLGLTGDKLSAEMVELAYRTRNEELDEKILEAPTPALRKKYMASKNALVEARSALEASLGGGGIAPDNLPVVDLPTSGKAESLPVLEDAGEKKETADAAAASTPGTATPGGSGALPQSAR